MSKLQEWDPEGEPEKSQRTESAPYLNRNNKAAKGTTIPVIIKSSTPVRGFPLA